jgi:hypothetical protein
MSKHKDHLGNPYNTLQDMCDYWKIKPNAYRARRKRGLSIEEALTIPLRCSCVDHLGKKFDSAKDMCEYWGVREKTYHDRKQRGLSLEQCLSSEVLPREYKQDITDHEDRVFKTQKDMCEYWGVREKTYHDRKSKGWPLKECLSKENTQNSGDLILDHLGKKFDSVKEMCDYWGVTYSTYTGRIKANYTQEEALTMDRIITGGFKESTVASIEERTDHLGTVFVSMNEMCKHWGIKNQTYRARLSRGYTKEEALTKRQKNPKIVIDFAGNKFSSIEKMCQHYQISQSKYIQRMNSGYPQPMALGLVPLLNNERKKRTNLNGTKIEYIYTGVDEEFYYSCTADGIEEILSRTEIIERCLNDKIGSINFTKK